MQIRFSRNEAWTSEGIAMRIDPHGERHRLLIVGDINPERCITAVLTPWECFRIGWLFIKRAVWP